MFKYIEQGRESIEVKIYTCKNESMSINYCKSKYNVGQVLYEGVNFHKEIGANFMSHKELGGDIVFQFEIAEM